MTGASLGHALLFCLFSFLFGAGTVILRAVLFASLAALRLLPDPRTRVTERNRVLLFFGYLLFDLSFFIIASSSYTVFLYVANGGVLRLYSILLALLAHLLLFRFAERVVTRPLYRLLSMPITLFGRLLRGLGENVRRNLTKAKKSCKIKSEQQKAGKQARISGRKHDCNQHTRAIPRLRR